MTANESNIVLIDAPTCAGKSRYIRMLGATPANTLTSEALMDELIRMCQSEASLEETAAKLKPIAYFENMESLAGRAETQRLAAELIRYMAKDHRVTLTGIEFQKRLPFFLNALGSYRTDPDWAVKISQPTGGQKMVSNLQRQILQLNKEYGLDICLDTVAEIYGEDVIAHMSEMSDGVIANIHHLISLHFGEDVTDICNRFGIILCEEPVLFCRKVQKLIDSLGSDYVEKMGNDMSCWEALM